MTSMITLEVTTNHYVVAAVSRSYFPRWFQAKTIAPYKAKIENSSVKDERVSESRGGELSKTTSDHPQVTPTQSQHMEQTISVLCDDPSRQPEIFGLSFVERANVQARLEQYQQSMELLEKAIDVQRKHLGDGHVDLAQTLSRRASIKCHFGYREEACADLKKAVRIVEAASHDRQKENRIRAILVELLIKSGLVHLQSGHRAEGMMNLEKALARLRDMGGPSDTSVAELLCIMAGVHQQQHDYAAASTKYEEALAIYKDASLPDDDLRVVEARKQMNRRNMLGHGFWSSSKRSSNKGNSRKRSAVV